MFIEVNGGPYDGVQVDSESQDPKERILATVFFRWAKSSLINKSFVTLSPAAIASSEDESAKDGLLQNHKYRLKSFSSVGGKDVATFEYLGHSTGNFVEPSP